MLQEILLELQETTIRKSQISLKLDSKVELQAIEANPASSTLRVSGELSI